MTTFFPHCTPILHNCVQSLFVLHYLGFHQSQCIFQLMTKPKHYWAIKWDAILEVEKLGFCPILLDSPPPLPSPPPKSQLIPKITKKQSYTKTQKYRLLCMLGYLMRFFPEKSLLAPPTPGLGKIPRLPGGPLGWLHLVMALSQRHCSTNNEEALITLSTV